MGCVGVGGGGPREREQRAPFYEFYLTSADRHDVEHLLLRVDETDGAPCIGCRIRALDRLVELSPEVMFLLGAILGKGNNDASKQVLLCSAHQLMIDTVAIVAAEALLAAAEARR
jgi:hypothetical protein